MNHILEPSREGTTFYVFSNPDGKTWAMPGRHMRTGMNLYQPSGIKGKTVKTLFPWLKWLPPVRNILKTRPGRYSLAADIAGEAARAFPGGGLEWAVFGGTPGAHRKATIQFSRGKDILGYGKVSGNPEIRKLFTHEQGILQGLKECGVRNVPECLFCGEIRPGEWLFLQTTRKTRSSTVRHQWGNTQQTFLEGMNAGTMRKLPFEETDFRHTLRQLREHQEWLPARHAEEVIRTVETILKHYGGRNVEFCMYHGDFTPWNTFEERGELFVFDWEYARRTYPPFLDYYHFMTQTGIFERHADAGQIHRMMKPHLEGRPDHLLAYQCYLADVIARFAIREKGRPEGDAARCLDTWTELLTLLNP